MGNGVQCKRAPVDVTDVNNGTALNATLSNVTASSDSCRKCMANLKNSSKFANLACKLACKGVEASSDVESNEDDSGSVSDEVDAGSGSGSDEIEEPVPTPAPATSNLTKVHKNLTLSGPRYGYFVIAMRSKAFENNNFFEAVSKIFKTTVSNLKIIKQTSDSVHTKAIVRVSLAKDVKRVFTSNAVTQQFHGHNSPLSFNVTAARDDAEQLFGNVELPLVTETNNSSLTTAIINNSSTDFSTDDNITFSSNTTDISDFDCCTEIAPPIPPVFPHEPSSSPCDDFIEAYDGICKPTAGPGGSDESLPDPADNDDLLRKIFEFFNNHSEFMSLVKIFNTSLAEFRSLNSTAFSE
jgi:hypothetical protein